MSLRAKGCYTSLAIQIASLAVGTVSILLYFGSGRRPLLAAAAELWASTFLGRWLPGVSAGLYRMEGWVAVFARELPFGPWVSGFVFLVAILGLRAFAAGLFGARSREVTYADVFEQLLFFLPLALLWIWIFSGVMTPAGLFLFLAGYLAGIAASVVVMAELT